MFALDRLTPFFFYIFWPDHSSESHFKSVTIMLLFMLHEQIIPKFHTTHRHTKTTAVQIFASVRSPYPLNVWSCAVINYLHVYIIHILEHYIKIFNFLYTFKDVVFNYHHMCTYIIHAFIISHIYKTLSTHDSGTKFRQVRPLLLVSHL